MHYGSIEWDRKDDFLGAKKSLTVFRQERKQDLQELIYQDLCQHMLILISVNVIQIAMFSI